MGADFNTAGLMLTAFFAGNLPMRFLGPLFLRRLSPRFIFSVFGCASAALMLAALFTDSISLMFVFVAACGFMQGSSVATFILMCTGTFPGRTASASSLCSLSSGVASLTAPLWMGGLSAYTGFQLPLIIICCCLMASGCLVFFKAEQAVSIQA